MKMASSASTCLALLLLCFLFASSSASRPLSTTTTTTTHGYDPMLFQYHKGPLLSGNFSINLLWYGKFTPAQRAIVSDFITSLSSSNPQPSPSVSTWWSSLSKYYRLANPARPSSLSLSLGHQILDDSYSAGRSLSSAQIQSLAASTSPTKNTRLRGSPNSIDVILTASDVAVERFCMSRCSTHGSTFIWVGNSESQCPGMCAWPFHQPIYGPQAPPLVAPNNDVGMDGVVMNLAAMLAGTATNPYGNGYFQGPKEVPLEAATACPGVYGRGAYPGYAGDLLVDASSGASYNANGINRRKYLLPGLYDPDTATCTTLV